MLKMATCITDHLTKLKLNWLKMEFDTLPTLRL